MTKKAVRQRRREQDPFYRPKPVEKPLHVGHGRHRLDGGPGPRKRLNLAPCFEQARALIDAALSWAGAGHAPLLIVPDESGRTVKATRIFNEAGLSRQEARAWELYCAGFSYLTIREFMDRQDGDEPLSLRTVEGFLYRGRLKMRRYVEAHEEAEAS